MVRRELHDLADPAGSLARKSSRDRKHLEDLMVSQARLCVQLAKAEEKVVVDEAAERRVRAQHMVQEATRSLEDVEARQAWARDVEVRYPWAVQEATRACEDEEARQAWARDVEARYPWASAPWTRSSERRSSGRRRKQQWAAQQWQFRDGSARW